MSNDREVVRIEPTDDQTRVTEGESANDGDAGQLTVQELEERIAPRKAGEGQKEFLTIKLNP